MEYGPIEGRPNEYAIRLVGRDSDRVYELFTDRPGIFYRTKEEKDNAARP